ncbi:MAG TPA: hypothetical protein VLZ53_04760, partial [Devosia sp.]|nr:hypothetical protein [Devosia sp.]
MSVISEKTLVGRRGANDRSWSVVALGYARRVVMKLVLPALTLIALWYLAIYWSGLPAFVLPRPEAVL